MMELNNVQLTPRLLTDLYGHSLVQTGNENETVQPKPETAIEVKEVKEENSWKYLGNNKKKILIAVRHDTITHLPDEDLTFLTNVLAACHLTLDDVAIVNTNNYPEHSYKEYSAYFNCTIILLFGIDPVTFGLPLDFPHFQVQNFSKYTILHSPPLKEYDKLLKSKLWVSLKRIFQIG